MATSHVVAGWAAWLWAAPHLGLPALDPTALTLATAGALLPDIDHPQSWIGLRLRFVSRPLAAAIGHRGVTHSIVAALGCFVVLRWDGLSREIVDPVVVGYLSHLAADFLTPAGLRLIWPLKRRFAVPLCRTGSPIEPAIVTVLLLWSATRILALVPRLGL